MLITLRTAAHRHPRQLRSSRCFFSLSQRRQPSSRRLSCPHQLTVSQGVPALLQRCLLSISQRTSQPFWFSSAFSSMATAAARPTAVAGQPQSLPSPYFPDPFDSHHLLDRARLMCAELVLQALPLVYSAVSPDAVSALRSEVVSKLQRPSQRSRGELTLPCFVFNKKADAAFTLPPPAAAAAINQQLTALLAAGHPDVQKTEAAAAYINFYLSPGYLASVLPGILDGSFLAPLTAKQPKIMVEYSQPNSHKAFHVGHMRNCALGDCLVRLYAQLGHQVVAANYFGDEGAHVAKCLWWLRRWMTAHPEFVLDSVPEEERGEWLGGFYTQAVEQLDLALLTAFPFPSVVPARVLSIAAHPNAAAPKNWRVVRLSVSEEAGQQAVTVVCGGVGYAVGDTVAYMPVGAKVKGAVVSVKDMMGVQSSGIMMSEKELGVEAAKEEAKDEKKEEKTAAAAAGKKQPKAAAKPPKEQVSDAASQRIHLLPASLPLGQPVTESGRLASAGLPPSVSVMEEYERRKREVRETLHGMEHGDAELVPLWHKTRDWSLREFKRIYAWLDCRFDHDFFESEVSEESRLMALDYHRRGVFVNSNGAVGADLSAFGLGFAMVLKSDGSGLYATKDLALAKRKFEQFGIDQSVYVVDAAQSLHFRQVFKMLELMGYEQATRCLHISYGQVTLPSGKMSSRAGNVILFSQLRDALNADIHRRYLHEKLQQGQQTEEEEDDAAEQEAADTEERKGAHVVAETAAGQEEAKASVVSATDSKRCYTRKARRQEAPWTVEEVAAAQHAIVVATIKYGMLNHDTVKDIVFVLEQWADNKGNTGPYMLYAFSRIQSIIRKVQQLHPDTAAAAASAADLSLLNHELERALLTLLHEYWDVVESCTLRHNPSGLCEYLFDISKAFQIWYEKCSIVRAETEELRRARLCFIQAIALLIKNGLGLLGIRTIDRM